MAQNIKPDFIKMNFIKFICPICKKESEKYVGHFNRSNSIGAPVYCGRICAGIGRRDNKTVEQKKKEKAEYDKKFRTFYYDTIKDKKAKAFKIDYAANPEKYKKERQRRYPEHLKYLQRPEYKAWKKDYDEKFRANKLYGEFAEASIILTKVERELESKAIKAANGITFNKSSQQRKRKWQQLSKVLLSKL